MKDRKLIIAFDFDGTVVQNQWPDIGEPFPGTIDILRNWQYRFNLILWTCRINEYLDMAIEFLHCNGITNFVVNRNVENLGFETSNKIFADVYIDDRAMIPDWSSIDAKLTEMQKQIEELRK